MRASSVLLAAASLLVASTNAECGHLAPHEIAILANCGDTAELGDCLTQADNCIKKCLLLAGCSDIDAASFAKWVRNDCKETRTFGDLKKRVAADEDKAAAEDTDAKDAEATTAADAAKDADPATETANADAATTAAETVNAETTAAETENTAAETTAAETKAADTTAAETTAAETTAEETPTAAVTTSKASADAPLVCLTTKFVATSSCTSSKGDASSVCVPTTTPEIGCGPGLLCQMTETGEQICMTRKDAPDLGGTIVTCCLAVFLAAMIGTVIFMACKTKKEQQREKKMAEALAIANGTKPPGTGGVAATEAYVPLMGGRGRKRDSSANPFDEGSARNSRRPSTLGMGATSPGGYGGMSETRSLSGSRAPSPLGMPGATEDLSYGGGRRI